jgi:nitroreductase
VELTEAIRDRRSTAAMTDDAPSDDDLARFVAVAAHAPDHAALQPWRLVTVRGEVRERLGHAWVEGCGDEPGSDAARKTASKPLRAPLLVGIIGQFVPEHPKVPEWEQVAAIAALVATLQLVFFEAGYTAMWRTGPAVDLAPVFEVMGVKPDEKLMGWLYVGGTAEAGRDGRRDPDVGAKITSLG